MAASVRSIPIPEGEVARRFVKDAKENEMIFLINA
jgi:hypothetical protein